MSTTSSKAVRTPARKAAATKRAAAPARKAPAAKAPTRKAAPSKVKAKPAPAKVAAATQAKPAGKKHKLVRDSFTMPQPDFDLIGALKKRALAAGHAAKKSELLRAGLHALTKLEDAALRAALDALVKLKAGRPRKER